MSNSKAKRRTRLRSYEVLYYLEQGFSLTVKAKSAQAAEHMVSEQLNEDQDVLPGSTRGHYDAGVVQSEEVRS